MRSVLLALVFLLSLPVFAQETETADSISEKAERDKLAKEALSLCQLGAFEKGIEKWEELYTRSKNPGILNNLASCYWEQGNLIQAKRTLEKLLSQLPEDHTIRPTLLRQLDVLEKSMEVALQHLQGLKIEVALPESLQLEEGPKTRKRRSRAFLVGAISLGAVVAGSVALSVALVSREPFEGTDLGKFPLD